MFVRSNKFMAAIAGNFTGYEEALRALYRKDKKTFLSQIKPWPEDIREHVLELGIDVFE